jgi:hypothetical protein
MITLGCRAIAIVSSTPSSAHLAGIWYRTCCTRGDTPARPVCPNGACRLVQSSWTVTNAVIFGGSYTNPLGPAWA